MESLRVLTVSELTGAIKNLIEDSIPRVLVEGEVSNWRPSSSGHVYFTLKDSGAALQAVMFRGRVSHLAFRPADGMLVRASGTMSVYAARGQYQLVVDSMEKAGAGDILAMLEERKQRLAAEGLFDQSNKKPIPAFPARVTVITSPTGAAIRDIVSVLGRRAGHVRITVLPALVQGDEAPASLIRQLKVANAFSLGDVIIIGRGGGSLEDLLAFSDEGVVREVAASSIPVISAVGHEIDWSLCDFAASMRAPTPSAAAELVSHSAEATSRRITVAADGLVRSMRARLEKARLLVETFSAEGLELRFERVIQPLRQRFDDAKESMIDGIRQSLLAGSRRLEAARKVLEASDPMDILARGYAVIRKPGNSGAIRDASALSPEDTIEITLAVGSAEARIIGTHVEVTR